MHSAIPVANEKTFNPRPRWVISNTRQMDSKTNPLKTRATPVFLDISDRQWKLDSIPLRVINFRHSVLRRLLLDLGAVADDHDLRVV